MRALVIGTSNSIMRGGWFDGFAASYSGTVVRCVLGGSPFWQFLGQLEVAVNGNYSHIIIDTSPNDESHYSQIGHLWYFEKLYFDFLSYVSRRAHTIVMRIPPQQWLSRENAISAIQRRCCEALGIVYYDISDEILTLAEGRDVYLDKLHPHVSIMYQVGQSLCCKADTLVDISKLEHLVASPYEELPLEGDHLEKEVVETSVVKRTFFIIKENQIARLCRPRFCFGFFANLQNCQAAIQLRGAGGSRTIFCYFEKRERPTISFVTIRNGFVLDEISIVKPAHTHDYAIHSKVEPGPYVASIGSVLCYRD